MTFKNQWHRLRWLGLSLLLLLTLGSLVSFYLQTAQLKCLPFCQAQTYTLPFLGVVDISFIFFAILVLAAGVFILVEFFLFWATLRGPTPAAAPTLPFVTNTKLDVFWTALPALLLAVLLGFSLYAFAQAQTQPPAPTLEVQAIGHEWWWEFRYPALNITTNYELVVPHNATIHLVVTSADVAHNLWVPALFGQTAALPGITTTLTFQAPPNTDFFSGECAEVCGVQHTQMYAGVRVLALADFTAWVSAQQRPPAPPTDPAAIAGQKVFVQAGCAQCHQVAGAGSAPNLSHLQSQRALAGGILPNTPADLRAWLIDPEGLKPGAGMPNPNLSATDLAALMAYLLTLK